MKVVRFNTISIMPDVMKLKSYDIKTSEASGEYCVDTSHFVPKSEALASFRRAGDIANSGFYDFPDGRDTGASLPFARSADYHGDIAEISKETRVSRESAQSAVDKSKVDFTREQILNSNVDTGVSSGVSSGASSGASSGSE